MESAIVRGVLALGHAAILLDPGACFGNFLRVLVGDALSALVVRLGVRLGPPIAQVALRVELASLVVKPVDDFVADDRADRTVIYGIALLWIEEGRLEDAGGKIDGVGLWIFVGVDGGRGHTPLSAVERRADFVDPAQEFKSRRVLTVE